MLTDVELEGMFDRLDIPDSGRRLIRTIRSSPPVRVVRSSSKNTTTRYPSMKMGRIIQAESISVEYRLVLLLEYDDDVIEYYDQPTTLTLNYRARSGRNTGVRHTPDYCVIRRDSITFVECKAAEKMDALHARMPHRYVLGSEGEWRCHPGEEAVAEFGFLYEVWTPSKLSSVLTRNLVFLEDYLLDNCPEPDEAQAELVRLLVRDQPGITLEEMLQILRRLPDDQTYDNHTHALYYSIAHRGVYVDLTATPLGEPDIVRLYPHAETAEAQRNLLASATSNRCMAPAAPDITIGRSIQWHGQSYDVIGMNDQEVTLSNVRLNKNEGEIVSVPWPTLLKDCGSVPSIPFLNEDAWEILSHASPKDREVATYRYHCLLAEAAGDGFPDQLNYRHPSRRTLRRWKKRYRDAEQRCGFGYLGLLPRRHRQGNREPRITPEMEKRISTVIREVYRDKRQRSVRSVYSYLVRGCKQEGLTDAEIPSFATFNQRVRDDQSPEQDESRKGKKLAYQVQLPLYIAYDTPRHGDQSFEIVHVDHTQFDSELRCSRTGVLLGRPYVSLATDAYSRVIPGVYLSFEPPSYRSVMMVLREIVRRFGRLPRTIVVDGGKEFSSTYFESLLAFYGITKRERTGNPRGGSVVERLFDTSNTEFVHLVMGSTQLMKDVRSVSAEVQPKKLAIWTLPLAYKRLRYWAYEVYDTTVHRILGQSPRDAFNYGIERSGKRPHTLISYDDFKILSLPAPPGKGGKRKVRRREGVQVKYIDYWCDAFENPRLWGKEVPVRYDPFNLDTVYAFVDSEWHLCRSPLSYLLLYRTEKELQVATEIERQRRRIGQRVYTSMAQLAEFLELIDDDEKVLRERWRAMENAHVLSAINEEAPPREMDPLDVQRDDTTEHDPDVPTLYDYDDADVFPEY